MVGMKDFIIEDKVTGLLTLNLPRLEELSDTAFNKLYVEEMDSFMKFFMEKNGKNPTCSRCSNLIENPDNLVRYFGENLDLKCFKEAYSKERGGLEERETRYFDLISRVKDNVPTRI